LVLLFETVDCTLVAIEFGNRRVKLRGMNERLADENPADQQANDDQHDGKFEEGEALAHVRYYDPLFLIQVCPVFLNKALTALNDRRKLRFSMRLLRK
jgi:hypothetical protein